ncbi:MAG: FKBP-type peptidyl-prolyl cis-trans isomerase [Acidobacteriota bacterium]
MNKRNKMSMTSMALVLAVLVLACTGAPSGVEAEEVDAAAAGEQEKTLYALGLALAQNVANFGLDDAELVHVLSGFEDGALGREAKVDLQEYGPKLQELARGRMEKAAEKEAAESEKFLTEQAAVDGVEVTDSGLIYTSLTEGSGDSPAATDQVKVHYHGTLRTGEVFDSSVDRGEPATFGLNQVIACWTEGVQKMKVGGKSRLVCPPTIAYGDRGAPPKIPPKAALVFEVELLEIVK